VVVAVTKHLWLLGTWSDSFNLHTVAASYKHQSVWGATCMASPMFFGHIQSSIALQDALQVACARAFL
jgi:hypothetical protein